MRFDTVDKIGGLPVGMLERLKDATFDMQSTSSHVNVVLVFSRARMCEAGE